MMSDSTSLIACFRQSRIHKHPHHPPVFCWKQWSSSFMHNLPTCLFLALIIIVIFHIMAFNVEFQSHNDHRQNQWPVDHIPLLSAEHKYTFSGRVRIRDIQRSWYNFKISSPVDWAKDKYHQDSHLSPSPNPSSLYLPPRTGRSGSRFPGGYNVAITKPSLGQQGCILHFPRLRVMNMGITWIWELKIMLPKRNMW